MVKCRLAELRFREVINICDGFRLGYVYDAVFDQFTGQIAALVVPGPCRFFGIFGREDDFVIPWECIRKIGNDIILIEVTGQQQREKRPKRPLF